MTDSHANMINEGGPERIWIESDGECPYFYLEEELADVAPPITEYVRADKLEALAAALEAAQTGLRYVVRVYVLSDEIKWSEEKIDEVVESIISDAKKEAGNG